MDFNSLIKNRLSPILQKQGFGIVEEFKNAIQFQSHLIDLYIVLNEFEKSCYISIGKKGKPAHELRNNAIKELFHSSLSVEYVAPETFVENLSTFFETKEGISLLKEGIDEFIKFKTTEDENYTSALLREQTLRTASEAWNSSDYKAYIESIDKIGINRLPKSYILKYKLAKKLQ